MQARNGNKPRDRSCLFCLKKKEEKKWFDIKKKKRIINIVMEDREREKNVRKSIAYLPTALEV